MNFVFFFSSRRRHTRYWRDWSSDVCSSDLSQVVKRIEDLVKDEKYFKKEIVLKEQEQKNETTKKEENIAQEVDSNNQDFWIVEFHEGLSLTEKDYTGQKVTKKLLDEIKDFDETIYVHNKIAEEDKRVGYSKFYFDHIVNGNVEEHYRMDIGDRKSTRLN